MNYSPPRLCPIVSLFAACLVGVIGSPARAQSPDESTARVAVTLGGGAFAAFPGSREVLGPALRIAKPVLVGGRGSVFQVRVDLASTTIFGLGDRSGVWEIVSLVGHLDIYLGTVFGFEFNMGVAGLAQLASPMAAGAGMAMGGAWVFRCWEDDRKRLKLELAAMVGSYFGDDEGNDLGLNAAGGMIGIGYETPF